MQRIVILPFIVMSLLFLWACAEQRDDQILRVAVASSAIPPIEVISKMFEAQSDFSIQLIGGSSGKLTTQIEQGGPFDIFISADKSYPDYLYKKDLTENIPQKYGTGQLVIFSLPKNKNLLGLFDLKEATFEAIDHIAIANPQVAPYGRRAQDHLSYHAQHNQISDRLVIAENVSQVVQFVLAGHAEIGFTSLSKILQATENHKLEYQLVDLNSDIKLDHYFVAMKSRNKEKTSMQNAFVKYILSESSQDVFTKYGFK